MSAWTRVPISSGGITTGSGSDVMCRRRPLRIDLSKRLWHDAAGMSLKETFARDGFVGIRGFFGANLVAAGVSG
jgi:hypothetical protein